MQPTKACPNCGAQISAQAVMCPQCKADLVKKKNWFAKNPTMTALIGAGVFLLFIVVIIGAISAAGNKDTAAKKDETPIVAEQAATVEPVKTVIVTTTVTTPAPTPPPPPPPPPPSTFSGVGQKATQKFPIGKGLATFSLKHDGQSNFAVLLLDNNGSTVELLVNEIGPFNGSKAVKIPKDGDYLLDISADGNWTISFEQ